MKIKRRHIVPLTLGAGAAVVVCVLSLLTRLTAAFPLLQRLEWLTYDWRVRLAADHPAPQATNLGFAFVQEESIAAVLSGGLGYRAGLYWPRHVYGRLVDELTTQGAKAIGFDVLFANRRPDHPDVELPDGTVISSDAYFARAIREAGQVVLAAVSHTLPADLFRTNACSLGDISAQADSDGVLRRIAAFQDYYLWHPLIRHAAYQYGFDLEQPRFEPDQLYFPPNPRGESRTIQLTNGLFNQLDLYQELAGQAPLRPVDPWQVPATPIRVWDLGIVLAARDLDLDLSRARVEPARGRIVLPGPNGLERVLPVDRANRLYIDWSIKPQDPRLTKEAVESLLAQERDRRAGATGPFTNRFGGKLVVVGSIATGNDLTDTGATPLEERTFLASSYWNVANSVILGRFIQPPSATRELAHVLVLCALAALLTWTLRSVAASLGVLVLSAAYLWLAVHFYVQDRLWWPVVFPVFGIVLSHLSLVSYRAFFEQKERRRIKAVFDRIVSPNVVNELLSAENLFFGGARRNLTVLFTDIRGFTQITDESYAQAEQYAREHHLTRRQAEEHYDAQSSELLHTVNTYLSLIADIVKKNEGTLDKYIGDCVMAFWGAPTLNPRHAVAAVRCAIEAQQAIHALNQQRQLENQRRQQEAQARPALGRHPLPPLQLLSLGTGINTGDVFVGLMGSRSHILNYTVFGRDVNLAERLEAYSTHGRIIIGQTTYQQLLRDDPTLAAACLQLPPATFKGFRTAVQLYEVSWQPA